MSSRSYSDEQAAAIAAAVLDRGMSQKAARDAAAKGELDGLEPFRLSLATTQRVVSRERDRRLQAEPFDVRSARLAKRALAVAEREMTRIERLSKLTAKDRTALDKLGRLAANLRSKPWRNKSADQVLAEGDGERPSFLKGLAQERQTPVAEPDPGPPEPEPAPAAPPPPKPPQKPAPPTIDEVLADLDRHIGEHRAAPTTLAQEAQAARAAHSAERQIITSPRSSAALRWMRAKQR